MSRKVLLVAAALLLAAGTVAAISARRISEAAHMHGGFDGPSGECGPRRIAAVSAERLKEMDANKDGVVTLEEFLGPRDADVRAPRQEQRRLR